MKNIITTLAMILFLATCGEVPKDDFFHLSYSVAKLNTGIEEGLSFEKFKKETSDIKTNLKLLESADCGKSCDELVEIVEKILTVSADIEKMWKQRFNCKDVPQCAYIEVRTTKTWVALQQRQRALSEIARAQVLAEVNEQFSYYALEWKLRGHDDRAEAASITSEALSNIITGTPPYSIHIDTAVLTSLELLRFLTAEYLALLNS